MEYGFAMIESTSRQIFPMMNLNGNSGVTRANVPQTSLALDSGATIYFFSNQELLQAIKKCNNLMTIHCGGSTFDQTMIECLRDDLNHLPLPKGEVCGQRWYCKSTLHEKASKGRIPCADEF